MHAFLLPNTNVIVLFLSGHLRCSSGRVRMAYYPPPAYGYPGTKGPSFLPLATLMMPLSPPSALAQVPSSDIYYSFLVPEHSLIVRPPIDLELSHSSTLMLPAVPPPMYGASPYGAMPVGYVPPPPNYVRQQIAWSEAYDRRMPFMVPPGLPPQVARTFSSRYPLSALSHTSR